MKADTRPLRPLSVILLVGVLIACGMFLSARFSYNARLERFTNEEERITNSHRRELRKFSFLTQPQSEGTAIGWQECQEPDCAKCLKIIFSARDPDQRRGIHLFMSLPLRRYHEEAALEFTLRTPHSRSPQGMLTIDLHEAQGKPRLARSELPIASGSGQRHYVVPLSDFSIVSAQGESVTAEEFSWEIQEIVFSFASESTRHDCALILCELAITHRGKVLSEIF